MLKALKKIPLVEPTYNFIFGYLEEQRPYSPQMFQFVLRNYEGIINRESFAHWFMRIVSFSPSKKTKYLFVGRKYIDLIQDLPRQEVMIVGSRRDWLYCLLRQIPFRPSHEVIKAALDWSDGRRFSIQKLQGILYCGHVTGRQYLILNNDSLPVERIFCLLAKQLEIITVCIQHGVFTSNSPSRVIDGGVADLTLTYDKHQLKLMQSAGVPENKLSILGFPANITRIERLRFKQDRTVCILGQPWGAYYPDIEKTYHRLLSELVALLNSIGTRFVFKPHPNELGQQYIAQFGGVERGSLSECFKKYDVFISFTSTALLEASLAGRVAIQIFDPAFFADNFSDLGYAHSINSQDLSNLGALVRDASPVSVKCDKKVGNRFLGAINDHFDRVDHS